MLSFVVHNFFNETNNLLKTRRLKPSIYIKLLPLIFLLTFNYLHFFLQTLLKLIFFKNFFFKNLFLMEPFLKFFKNFFFFKKNSLLVNNITLSYYYLLFIILQQM